MNLVGIQLKSSTRPVVKSDNSIQIKRIEVVKETDKFYKVQNSGLIFNCLTQIPKTSIGVILKENEWIRQIERKIWVLEDSEYNEAYYITLIKEEVKKELEQRIENNKTLIDTINCL